MCIPEEAGQSPPTLDLPPMSPPKFKAHRLRTPIQGLPRTLLLRQITNGLSSVFWAGVLYYLPIRGQTVEIAGKRKRRNSLLLPGFIFAYMTREKTKEFVKQPSRTAKFLKYYTDKTRPVEAETQLNPPITIADDRMRSFINVVETKNEHIMTAPKERCRFKSGDFFRVVCGDFKGVVGQVVRAAGQQRIAVELKGIGYVLTAYIPSDFMERIED